MNTRVTEEYRVLHNVAKVLQSPGELIEVLQKTMKALTEFEGLQVENKAGIFLADNEGKMLRLLTTYGNFSQEFLEKEKTVPFGDCLCGRAASSGKMLVSESCFTDLTQKSEKPAHEILTYREFQFFMGLASGKKIKEIADKLCLSINSISTYRSRIVKKMDLKNNAELIRYALKMGLLS